MANNQQLLLGEGAGGGIPNYIEEVFSTYLYDGTGAAQTITNGIDLSTKGGLVWIKDRNSGAKGHALFDTARGVNLKLQSQSANGEFSGANQLTAFNTTGFDLGSSGDPNGSGTTYASWTFREQKKFFDVVAWSGDGINRTIAHTLGAVPGCIIVKRTDGAPTDPWAVYHRSLTNTQYLVLNTTAATATDATWWNSTTPTSSVFSVGTSASVNASGGTYVAYLFAHDAGGFGLTGSDNVISCGSFTTDGAGAATVTLGYEPQWLLFKNADIAQDWWLLDNMRGWPNGTGDKVLRPNTADIESNYGTLADPIATGFNVMGVASARTYIYIAIRRGPMKVPTVGTSVFTTLGSTAPSPPSWHSTNFPVDLGFWKNKINASGDWNWGDRLRGGNVLNSNNTNAEVTNSQYAFDYQEGWYNGSTLGDNYPSWMFRRAPGFFDEVCYTGTGSATTVTHNLAAVPEMIITKARSSGHWQLYVASLGNTYTISLNGNYAAWVDTSIWNSTNPTASVFSVNSNSYNNNTGYTYVAYLFATCAGVSKVGSYTGNGSSQTIACGFAAGSRFVMIKRTDSTGDWYVWDSARGIVAGNDPYLSLNTTAAEVTTDDSVDTDNSGFIVNQLAATNVNVTSATYIFLAIA